MVVLGMFDMGIAAPYHSLWGCISGVRFSVIEYHILLA